MILAMTVFNTDESSNVPDPGPTGETMATGETANTGETVTGVSDGTTLGYAQAIPQPIDGPLLGMNLTAYTPDGYGQASVHKAIRILAGMGSTAITLVPTWYMKSPTANRIAPDKDKSPTDESLAKAIGWILSAGMQVVIKPHVDVVDDSYRGDIQPTNRDQWFRSYGKFIDHYASFATDRSADLLVVGTELRSLSSETDRWRAVIRTVRDLYTGPVTYAANWDEVDQVQFWDDLDAIGVDAYYPLSQDPNAEPGEQELVAAWQGIADQLESKSEQWDRPVILTEVGYPSQKGATVVPFDVTDQPADQKIQALAYAATFKALSGADWLEGISWWSWRADPGSKEPVEIDYSPEGKTAQAELAKGQRGFEG